MTKSIVSEVIKAAWCPAIRANMRGGAGLHPPLGHPTEWVWFPVRCPREGDGKPHNCMMHKTESRYRCSCGEEGDYFKHEGAHRAISSDEAQWALLKEMDLAKWSDLDLTPWSEKPWYRKRLDAIAPTPFGLLSGDDAGFQDSACLPKESDISHMPETASDADRAAVTARIHKLWTARTRSREIRVGMRRNALLALYQEGSLDYQIKLAYRALATDPSHTKNTWEAELRTRKLSRTSVDRAIRVFLAVEFCWQLAEFDSKSAVLKVISMNRSPSETITPDDSPTTIKLHHDHDSRPGRPTISIEIDDGIACTAAGRLSAKPLAKDECLSNAVDFLVAAFYEAAELAPCLANHMKALHTLVDRKPDQAGGYLDALQIGVNELSTCVNPPGWFETLTETHGDTPISVVTAKEEVAAALEIPIGFQFHRFLKLPVSLVLDQPGPGRQHQSDAGRLAGQINQEVQMMLVDQVIPEGRHLTVEVDQHVLGMNEAAVRDLVPFG